MIDAARGHMHQALVVDDDCRIRMYIKAVLRRANFQVFEACDGMEALEVFRASRNTLDIVITDVRMPRMTGSEFVFFLRRESDVPLIVISGDSEPERLHDAKTGFVFIEKPFGPKVLLDAVHRVLKCDLVTCS